VEAVGSGAGTQADLSVSPVMQGPANP